MKSRNTIQKDLVLNSVRKLGNHPSADEIYSLIIQDYPNIGKGTVYRNLNKLAEEGEILKIEIPNGSDRFDHTTTKHFHARCMVCGRIHDVELIKRLDIIDHLREKSGMNIMGYDLLFKGICSSCEEHNI
ncbi:MAG: transcriptional repressor [Eubacteriales bacterium]|nr:transcriptional repressor [Eubacteriales bacterium]